MTQAQMNSSSIQSVDHTALSALIPMHNQSFAAACIALPLIKSGNPGSFMQYLLEPCVWVGFMGTICVVWYARTGKQVELEPWENRAATWYLLNGFVFHYLFDFCVPILGVIPVLRENYQHMDTRYGCLPQYLCDGSMGVTRDPEPMPFVIASVEAFIDTPLCMYVFIAYLRGWDSRRPLEIILAVFQISGTIVFQTTELYRGLRHVPPPPHNVGGPESMFQFLILWPFDDVPKFIAQVLYFWFAYVIAYSTWYVVPGLLAKQAFEAILISEKRNSQHFFREE